jgi:hypothetical protein
MYRNVLVPTLSTQVSLIPNRCDTGRRGGKSNKVDRLMPKRYKGRRRGRLMLIVLGLAGLGVGVWLFGRRDKGLDWAERRDQNGR